jgi:hypothetical protein
MPIAHATFDAPARAHASARSSRVLDDLLALDAPALGALYKGATVPDIAAISGDLKGRMLAVPALKPPVATAIRAFASSSRFPWRGKSFTPLGAASGEGINRVIRDRWKLYRFETFVGPSRGGRFDAVQLDYDLPTNPFFIRPIKDEIRELSPGLYLGQAYLLLRGEAHLVLYFGLTSR